MDLENYLLEQKLGKNPDLMEFFNSFATQVFTQNFLNKIKKIIPKLNIRETVNNNNHMAAFTDSYNNIFINKPVFYQLSKTEQISVLLHEFIHILQFKNVREIKQLSQEAWNLLNKLKKPEAQMSQVVLGKIDIKKKFINRHEILPYLMNEKVRWDYLEDGAKEELQNLLKRSKVFQVDSRFWQERLK